MFSAKRKVPQAEFWIAAHQVTKPAKSIFYSKLDETLESFGFAAKVRDLCSPAYNHSGLGRPGIDPAVYLKMMMIGFFENLPGERAIAARCADSIAIREFLHYGLTEETPDHSSLSIIRQRLEGPIYGQVFTLVLSALQEHGLLRGKNLGIDSSVMEANASLRGLVNRNTGEAYWEYVKRLAAESGIDPQDSAAVRKFDRKRPKKMRNDEWENPNEPEAKIGPKKDGATDMIYKPEVVADLDSGAIVGAEVLPGNHADHQEVATHILEAQVTINAARNEPPEVLTVVTATADKGYFEVTEMQVLQQERIKTVICDPTSNRRLDKLDEAGRQAVKAARRSTQSKYGKQLLRRRGMHLERAFAHILDCGGMRRATLRGRQNLDKRFKLAAAFYNLSQLMRKLFGLGTPKQCEAMGWAGFGAFADYFAMALLAIALRCIRICVSARLKPNCFRQSISQMKMAA
jgi:transposase